MIRSLSVPVLWLGAALTVFGQGTGPMPPPDPDDEPVRNWVVKLAPLSLFDPDNTIQFGAERLLGRHQAVQLEAGYGFQGMNLWQNAQNRRYTDKEVWRSRAEWRYYLAPFSGGQGRYVAVEGFVKQVNVRETGTIGVGCSAGPCQYYRQFTAPLQKYVWGGHVKLGRQFSASDDDRLLIDYYMGLGLRNRQIERFRPAGPSASSFSYESAYGLFDSFSPVSYPVVSVSWGIKIGYAL